MAGKDPKGGSNYASSFGNLEGMLSETESVGQQPSGSSSKESKSGILYENQGSQSERLLEALSTLQKIDLQNKKSSPTEKARNAARRNQVQRESKENQRSSQNVTKSLNQASIAMQKKDKKTTLVPSKIDPRPKQQTIVINKKSKVPVSPSTVIVTPPMTPTSRGVAVPSEDSKKEGPFVHTRQSQMSLEDLMKSTDTNFGDRNFAAAFLGIPAMLPWLGKVVGLSMTSASIGIGVGSAILKGTGLATSFLKIGASLLTPVVMVFKGILSKFLDGLSYLFKGFIKSIKIAFQGILLPFKIGFDLVNLTIQKGNEAREEIKDIQQALSDTRDSFASFSQGRKFGSRPLVNLRKQFSLDPTGVYARTFGKGVEGINNVIGKRTEILDQMGSYSELYDQYFSNNQIDRITTLTRLTGALGLEAEDVAYQSQDAVMNQENYLLHLKDIVEIRSRVAKKYKIDEKRLSKFYNTLRRDIMNFDSLTNESIMEISANIKTLGLDIENVSEIMGKFNTFEDAAKSAAMLSQAFGMNIDAMKLIDTDNPLEILEMFKTQLLETGRTFESLNRHEKRLISNYTGLTGKNIKALMMYRKQGYSMEEAEKKLQQNSPVNKQLQAINKLTGVINTFKETINILTYDSGLDMLIKTIGDMIKYSRGENNPFVKISQSMENFAVKMSKININGLIDFIDKKLSPLLASLTKDARTAGSAFNDFFDPISRLDFTTDQKIKEFKEENSKLSGTLKEGSDEFKKAVEEHYVKKNEKIFKGLIDRLFSGNILGSVKETGSLGLQVIGFGIKAVNALFGPLEEAVGGKLKDFTDYLKDPNKEISDAAKKNIESVLAAAGLTKKEFDVFYERALSLIKSIGSGLGNSLLEGVTASFSKISSEIKNPNSIFNLSFAPIGKALYTSIVDYGKLAFRELMNFLVDELGEDTVTKYTGGIFDPKKNRRELEKIKILKGIALNQDPSDPTRFLNISKSQPDSKLTPTDRRKILDQIAEDLVPELQTLNRKQIQLKTRLEENKLIIAKAQNAGDEERVTSFKEANKKIKDNLDLVAKELVHLNTTRDILSNTSFNVERTYQELHVHFKKSRDGLVHIQNVGHEFLSNLTSIFNLLNSQMKADVLSNKTIRPLLGAPRKKAEELYRKAYTSGDGPGTGYIGEEMSAEDFGKLMDAIDPYKSRTVLKEHRKLLVEYMRNAQEDLFGGQGESFLKTGKERLKHQRDQINNLEEAFKSLDPSSKLANKMEALLIILKRSYNALHLELDQRKLEMSIGFSHSAEEISKERARIMDKKTSLHYGEEGSEFDPRQQATRTKPQKIFNLQAAIDEAGGMVPYLALTPSGITSPPRKSMQDPLFTKNRSRLAPTSSYEMERIGGQAAATDSLIKEAQGLILKNREVVLAETYARVRAKIAQQYRTEVVAIAKALKTKYPTITDEKLLEVLNKELAKRAFETKLRQQINEALSNEGVRAPYFGPTAGPRLSGTSKLPKGEYIPYNKIPILSPSKSIEENKKIFNDYLKKVLAPIYEIPSDKIGELSALSPRFRGLSDEDQFDSPASLGGTMTASAGTPVFENHNHLYLDSAPLSTSIEIAKARRRGDLPGRRSGGPYNLEIFSAQTGLG